MASLPGTMPRMMRPAPGQNYPRTGFPLEGEIYILSTMRVCVCVSKCNLQKKTSVYIPGWVNGNIACSLYYRLGIFLNYLNVKNVFTL